MCSQSSQGDRYSTSYRFCGFSCTADTNTNKQVIDGDKYEDDEDSNKDDDDDNDDDDGGGGDDDDINNSNGGDNDDDADDDDDATGSLQFLFSHKLLTHTDQFYGEKLRINIFLGSFCTAEKHHNLSAMTCWS